MQFTVYANRGNSAVYPLLLDVTSDIIGQLNRRVEVNRPKPSPDLKLRQVVTDILLWSQDFSCRHDA
ncbi:CcdB family protein, partial [Serratia sp. CY74308]|uniref:CcdB family protein n=1 Tax=Serratia sp. CY74308 TaxID=3383675 RepID=UPI003FA0F91A